MKTRSDRFKDLLSRRRLVSHVTALVFITAVFAVFYGVARRAVLDEIRAQAMGVASATAGSIPPAILEQIRTPDDMAKPAFQEVQKLISTISTFNSDVRYVYVMRRSSAPDALPSDYEYVVDQMATDENKDGHIAEDEQSEPTGNPYDASELEAMVEAWNHPTADKDITADPPYPDLISGYAPIRDAEGNTIAIVGADITAGTVGQKLLVVRVVAAAVWVIMATMVILLMQFSFEQRTLLQERECLINDLREALSSVTTLSGLLPICSCCKKIRNDNGYWEQVEQYFAERSNADFTHSICPECITKHYPEVGDSSDTRSHHHVSVAGSKS